MSLVDPGQGLAGLVRGKKNINLHQTTLIPNSSDCWLSIFLGLGVLLFRFFG